MRQFMIGGLLWLCATAAAHSDGQAKPWDQWATAYPDWVEEVEPFQVFGNIYFVGTKGLSSFLITGTDGHILIDGGLPQNAPQIAASIQGLGFKLSDIKILLNSHAHFDHSGGLAALKQLTGAKMIASEGDKPALEGGFYLGFEDRDEFSAPPVAVDETIKDGEVLRLGDVTLTAHITPGHTKGCTSFSMTAVEENASYDVLFFCGASVAANRLKPEQYDGIVEDYRRTFDATRNWQPDILLVNHPFYFDMAAKREDQINGDTLAFVDKTSFPKLMAALEAGFQKALNDQNAQ